MNDIMFNKSLRELNKAYFDLFGDIPCIENFSCSRQKYVDALKQSVEEKKKIEELLPAASNPNGSDILI